MQGMLYYDLKQANTALASCTTIIILTNSLEIYDRLSIHACMGHDMRPLIYIIAQSNR